MFDRWPEAVQIAHRAACHARARRWPGEFDDWRQEALLAAWQAHRAFDGHRGPYGAWIACSVRQRLVDALRRHNRERPARRLADLPDHRAPEDGPGIEYRDLLASLARHLTPAERRVVLAMFACGDPLTQHQTARDLAVSQAWVSRLQITAFARLRDPRTHPCLASA